MFAVLVLSSSISIKNYCSITSTPLHLLKHCCDVVSTIEEFPASVDIITYEKHALAVAYCSWYASVNDTFTHKLMKFYKKVSPIICNINI